MKIRPKLNLKIISSVFGLWVLFILAAVVLTPTKASALGNNNANVPWFNQNQSITTFECRTPPGSGSVFKHGQFAWISQRGTANNMNTTVQVMQGDDDVDLQLNTMAMNCDSNTDASGNLVDKSIQVTRTRTTNSGIASGPAGVTCAGTCMNGQVVDMNYGDATFWNNRYVKNGGDFVAPNAPWEQNFTIRGLAGLAPGTYTVLVNAQVKMVNHYSSGPPFVCVNNPGFTQTNNLDDTAGVCGFAGPTFPINIQIVSGKGGIAITKYGPNNSPDAQGHPQFPPGWADPSTVPGNNWVCVNRRIAPNPYNGIGCGQGNPMDIFGNTNSLEIGAYEVGITPPAGYRIKAVRGGWPPGPYATLPNNNNVNVFVFDNLITYVDVYYEPIPPEPICSAVGMLNPLNSNLPFGTETPEVGQPVTMVFSAPSQLPPGTTTFDVDNFAVNPAGLTGLSYTGPPVPVANTIQVNNISSANAQKYTFTYTVSWQGTSPGSKQCTGEITFANKPYLRVYGNDIRAGGGMKVGNSCTAPSNDKATILTYDDMQSSNATQQFWRGAGAELAAFALGEISNFNSATQNNPRTFALDSRARPRLDLNFGNFNPAGANSGGNPAIADLRKVHGYGGVNAKPGCVDDYVTAIKDNGGAVAPATISSNPMGVGVAQYREGDVVINSNIDYPASWADGSTPSYYLAVKGNIYIQPGVQRLSGVFIAQEDPSRPNTGRIYTCAEGSGLYDGTELFNACRNNRLTVNGAFVAKQIKFQRAIDSLRLGNSTESAGSSRAAEVFDFGPETYIANPHPSLKGSGSTKVQYDFITSLPPIF